MRVGHSFIIGTSCKWRLTLLQRRVRSSLLRLIATSAVFALAICGVTMGGSTASAGASSTKPNISSFVAAPDSLTPAGGSVLLSATVTNATSCTLSSTPAINGLPVTASCASGTVNENVAVSANPTCKADKYMFTLAAIGATTTKTKALKLSVAATPAPTVSSPTVTPSSVTSSGGLVTLSATVANAISCTFSSSPAVPGLPATIPCTNGTVNEQVMIPADTGKKAITHKFRVAVTGTKTVKSPKFDLIETLVSGVAPPGAPTPSSSVAFVQSDDTGTINGNTTSIGSGQSNQVLAQDTGIGHSVVLMIQTLTDPGTETDTVTSVSSGMGTFQFVNSYNDGADTEIWVCPDTTGAADTVTVNTSTNAWNAFAVEFNAAATGFVNGGGQVVDLPHLGDQSWTVSPGAAGNIAFVGVDTLDAYETAPAAPWTYYNSGYWDFSNGTSAAWQVAPSSSPLTASWETDGGESSSQGVVLEY